MNSSMSNIAPALVLAVFLVLSPFIGVHQTIGAHDAFAAASSDLTDTCGWVCKNLKQDWNYLFHPERVNQCVPHGLKMDTKLLEQSKKAFTSDDPLIPHYCGSPFSPAR